MRKTRPRSAFLGTIAAGLTLAGLVSAAGAAHATPAAGLQAAAAPPTSVIFGQACPDVMVIGAPRDQ
jgi:hypothetical protein